MRTTRKKFKKVKPLVCLMLGVFCFMLSSLSCNRPASSRLGDRWTKQERQAREALTKFYSSAIEKEGIDDEMSRIEKTVETTKIVLLGGVDITTLNVNVIVNAPNYQLKPHVRGGVCEAIHKAAGPGLAAECNKFPEFYSPGFDTRYLKRCPVGEAVITNSYNLTSRGIKYIVHAVGPAYNNSWSSIELGHARSYLTETYTNSLTVAKKHDSGIRSIAFPCISTGPIFEYPREEAAPVAFKAVCDYITDNPGSFDEIIFACFTKEDYNYYKVLFEKDYDDCKALLDVINNIRA